MGFDNVIAGRLDSVSSFGPALASTRIILSVSNSPIEMIQSLKKRRKGKKKVPLSAVFNPTLSTSDDFSLPFAPLVKTTRKRKADTDASNGSKRPNMDDVFD